MVGEVLQLPDLAGCVVLSLVKSLSARKIGRLGPPFLTADSRSDRTPEVEIVSAISQRSRP